MWFILLLISLVSKTRKISWGPNNPRKPLSRSDLGGYSVIAGSVVAWPIKRIMCVPIRYWEARSRLVPLRRPLAAPAPHGDFLRPWFLGFEDPHPPPAAVVHSAWVPRRRDTPEVLLFFC